ncbi:MAG: hypothetical protein ABIR81_00385 [Ginsengibacter sp.]
MKFLIIQKSFATALIAFSLVVLCSCHRKFANGEEASPEIIIITQSDSTSGKLTLRDANGNSADTFKVKKGRKIQWLLIAKETATDLTNIYKKDSSVEVFSRLPHRLGTSANWEGRVSTDAEGRTEDYNIEWTDLSGDKHTFDPKIQVQ